jgi:hypothetical protein
MTGPQDIRQRSHHALLASRWQLACLARRRHTPCAGRAVQSDHCLMQQYGACITGLGCIHRVQAVIGCCNPAVDQHESCLSDSHRMTAAWIPVQNIINAASRITTRHFSTCRPGSQTHHYHHVKLPIQAIATTPSQKHQGVNTILVSQSLSTPLCQVCTADR